MDSIEIKNVGATRVHTKGVARKLYFDSKAFTADMLHDIDRCVSSIDIEMYIWAADSFAQVLERRLIEARHRGVRVRILVDGIGSYDWIQSGKGNLVKHGVTIRVFNPVPKLSAFINLPQKVLNIWGLVNRRNHRKLVIIDGQICYMGSSNVMSEAVKWRENGLRITGVLVNQICELHFDVWKKSENFFNQKINEKLSVVNLMQENKLMFTTQYSVMRKNYRAYFYSLISNAKNRIWLMTPYFNPPRGLLNLLIKAAARGIDVRIVLPMLTDVPVSKWLAQRHYLELINNGIKLFEYQPRILHAKGTLIDNISMVGSGNLNHRSFFKDIELNVVLDEADTSTFETQFYIDFRNSKRILVPTKIAFWKKIIASILSFFKDSF